MYFLNAACSPLHTKELLLAVATHCMHLFFDTLDSAIEIYLFQLHSGFFPTLDIFVLGFLLSWLVRSRSFHPRYFRSGFLRSAKKSVGISAKYYDHFIKKFGLTKPRLFCIESSGRGTLVHQKILPSIYLSLEFFYGKISKLHLRLEAWFHIYMGLVISS